jgi:DNA repair exonuclease SbcCD ATPase subunit
MRTARTAFCVIMIAAAATAETDWSSCSSDLHGVQRAARDAADAADGLQGKKQEGDSRKHALDEAKERAERCRRYRDQYDLYSDNCETLSRRERDAKREYETASEDYTNAVQQLQSELDDIRTYTKRSESSCAADEQAGTSNPAVICAALKDMKGKYPNADLLAACKMRLPEESCRLCLGLR